VSLLRGYSETLPDNKRPAQTRYAPLRYKAQLKSAIDVLRAALPRTLVQLVSPHVTQLSNVNAVSSYCKKMHKWVLVRIPRRLYRTACPCLTHPDVEGIQNQYQSLARTIPAEYEGSADFAVVAQTFMEESKLPRDVRIHRNTCNLRIPRRTTSQTCPSSRPTASTFRTGATASSPRACSTT